MAECGDYSSRCYAGVLFYLFLLGTTVNLALPSPFILFLIIPRLGLHWYFSNASCPYVRPLILLWHGPSWVNGSDSRTALRLRTAICYSGP